MGKKPINKKQVKTINSNLPSVTGAKYSIVCGDKYE